MVDSARPPAHILVVDDEEAVLQLLGHQISRFGYRVTTFLDSVLALDHFLQDPTAFDLLFTDLSMPGLNGVQLARKVLAVRSDLPVILCTGNPLELPPSGAGSGIRTVLVKPVPRPRLAEAVAACLGG